MQGDFDKTISEKTKPNLWTDTWFSLEYFTWVPLRLHGLGCSPCTVLRGPAPAIKVRKELLPSLLLVVLVSCQEVWLETNMLPDGFMAAVGSDSPIRSRGSLHSWLPWECGWSLHLWWGESGQKRDPVGWTWQGLTLSSFYEWGGDGAIRMA